MSDPKPAIPGLALGAAALWLLFGGLALLLGLVSLNAGTRAYAWIIVGLVFGVTGLQVLLGKVTSIRGAGVACLVLGGIGLLEVLFAAPALRQAVPTWLTIVGFANVALMLLAGVLAVAGDAQYKAWRATRG